MITELTIKNMRCFKEFSIDGLTRLTLISGLNGIGKSTLLESIILLLDRRSPDIFAKLNSFRGNVFLPNVVHRLWEPLFSDMDSTQELVVSVRDNNVTKILRLRKNENLTTSFTENHQDINNDFQKNFPPFINNSNPLNFSYCCGDNGDNYETGNYYAVNGNMTIKFDSPPCQYTANIFPISSYYLIVPNVISEWFGKIELSGKKNELLNALRILNPDIVDLFTVVSEGIGYIYATDKTGGKLPIQEMGGGINKLLLIALTMIANPRCIVLIDEIENGFHYSFHSSFWKIMDKLTSDTDCQILATTHSYECIQGAVNGVNENTNSDSLRFIRLEELNKKIVPHIFTKEMLTFAINSQVEVR